MEVKKGWKYSRNEISRNMGTLIGWKKILNAIIETPDAIATHIMPKVLTKISDNPNFNKPSNKQAPA